MKELLLLMTDFYGYNEDIISELEKQGWNVTWFQDKIPLNTAEGLVTKVLPKYKENKFNRYFHTCLESVKDKKYDLILIIFGALYLQKEHISFLRKQFTDTKIVYYSWDSVKNFPLIKDLFRLSDVAYTFDSNDAIKYNVNFLPLFYSKNICETPVIKYDISTVMSFFAEKAASLNEVITRLPSDCKSFIYLRIRTRRYLWKLKHFNKKKVQSLEKYFNLASLPREEVLKIFAESKAVIDCPLPGQNGLTMRTFEVLSMGKKLITSNESIRNYDFYCKENVLIMPEEADRLESFLELPFNRNYLMDSKYSVSSFVKTLTSV